MTTVVETRPAWEPHTIEEIREGAFQRYIESTENYFSAVRERGRTPWFSSVEERRELFMRRYTRPDPPIVAEWWPFQKKESE
ncbi:hypothetical protein [Nocardia grenadensis]|uniref:hypothetical protein n=1 Tax=Nocardia grenadensis TaxID=931537 RepID=UPI003D717FAC